MAATADETKLVPLKSIFIAPENPRAAVPADEGIAQLGRTLIACQVYPILARPASKGEEGEYGALDGRRRYLGFQSALAEGLITEDHLVSVTVITDKARQNAAITLANHEREPGHITDVIMAIGRMMKAKLKTPAIAKALGYTEMQIRRWSKLAELQPSVLNAMRCDRIDLKTAQLMTRLSPESQDTFAERAIEDRYGNINYYVSNAVMDNVITIRDDRFGLVSLEEYAAEGGRLESDLFEATDDVVLDAEILQRVWTAKAAPIAEALKAAGLTVTFSNNGYMPPEGFVRLPYGSASSLPAAERRAYDAAFDEYQALQNAYRATFAPQEAHCEDDDEAEEATSMGSGDLAPPTIVELLLANLATTRALHIKAQIGAVVLQPDEDYGLTATFHAVPQPIIVDEGTSDDEEEEAVETPSHYRADVAVPEVRVDVEGVNHSLHERYTVVATQGLIRTVADNPAAAFVLLVARMFVAVAMPHSASADNSISTIRASRFSHSKYEPIGELDGEIFGRLVAFKDAYMESGLRPIPWVESLGQGERMTLMTVLVALSLDGKEMNTWSVRRGARAEAAEIAELTGHDITEFWTPDAVFFAAHSKKQILPMLPLMGAGDDPTVGTLKKDELAGFAAESAEAARWAPASLSWKQPEAELVELDEGEQSEDSETSFEADDADADLPANNDDDLDVDADEGVADEDQQADLAA